MKPKIELASFDMDGTVLRHESSWGAVHRHFGTEREGATSLKLYTEGRIDYKEFMRRDIASWPKGITRGDIERILSGYQVRPEAPGTINELRRRGIKTALVSSGIDIVARKVAAELKIDYWVANGISFDRKGKARGEGIGRVDPTRKDVAYKKLLAKVEVRPERTIAVGDTIYDLGFLRSAKLGFMLAHTTRVDDPKIIHIESLTEIFEHI